MDKLSYTGAYLQKRNTALGLEPYAPSAELVEAVNMAFLLDQPLLLMGEPGSGKTRLAESVAAELHKTKMWQHFFRWDIKSTTKARDGIYQYDALGRLYDANAKNVKAKKPDGYISYGKFADAATHPQNGKLPNVLLIDEIDKADIDFPNDLLLEIEKKEFFIPELQKKIERRSDFVILITSNRERELPPAFLRRCLYQYIKFPEKEDLQHIIVNKFGAGKSTRLLENSVAIFLDIRKKIDGNLSENEKKPATSELLEWFRLIHHYSDPANKPTARVSKLIRDVETYKEGNLDKIEIPFRQALLKTWESNQLFKK